MRDGYDFRYHNYTYELWPDVYDNSQYATNFTWCPEFWLYYKPYVALFPWGNDNACERHESPQHNSLWCDDWFWVFYTVLATGMLFSGLIYGVAFFWVFAVTPSEMGVPPNMILKKMKKFFRPPFFDTMQTALDTYYYGKMVTTVSKLWLTARTIWCIRGMIAAMFLANVTTSICAAWYYIKDGSYFMRAHYRYRFGLRIFKKSWIFSINCQSKHSIKILRLFLGYMLGDGPNSIIQWFFHEKVRSDNQNWLFLIESFWSDFDSIL